MKPCPSPTDSGPKLGDYKLEGVEYCNVNLCVSVTALHQKQFEIDRQGRSKRKQLSNDKAAVPHRRASMTLEKYCGALLLLYDGKQ